MNSVDPYRIMLSISDPADVEHWVRLAASFAPDECAISVRGLLTVPDGVSLSESTLDAQQMRDALNRLAQDWEQVNDTAILVDYQPMMRLLEELRTQAFDLFVSQWNGPLELTGGAATNDLLMFASCDMVLLARCRWVETGPVLLSLRGGPNLSLGVRTASALAAGARVTLINVAPTNRAAADVTLLTQSEAQISRAVTAVGDTTDNILREMSGHQAIVMGAGMNQATTSTESILHQIYHRSTMPIAMVRAWQPEALEFHAPLPLRRKDADLSTRVDRWFAENTYHSHEFADLHALLALKEKHGLTISVALPALNEEATVGNVIQTLKAALMDDIPLVDELVLIDSASTDQTVAIAERLGIPVYKHPDVLADITGSYRGKGEALWKSLHVVKGDIIAWVDTDITNIHPRFIYGLLGPLLKYPHLQYVKGFYARPIKVGEKMQAFGGGRVTELVARPLLNLFYPELSGIVQPLSGEYAGRRSALERMPFFSGYGVETGLLIDFLNQHGLEAIAQTDLEVRVHHNQPLVNLSKMSFAVIQVFINRLENRYSVQLLEKANRSMKLIVQEPDRFALEVSEIGDVERPPMMSLEAYRQRHYPQHDHQAQESD